MEVQLLAAAESEFKSRRCRRKFQRNNNFLKSCKWSPDGSCLLTNSDDGVLRIFATPHEVHQRFYEKPAVDSTNDENESTDNAVIQKTAETAEAANAEAPAETSNPATSASAIENATNETVTTDAAEIKSLELHAGVRIRLRTQVYDASWFPSMCYTYPETCCFAVASFDSPLILLDAYTGASRATYRAFNLLDELVPLYSVAFDANGTMLYGGSHKTHRRFDISRPGNDSVQIPRVGAKYIQGGIHSCFAFHNSSGCYAVGSYNHTVGLYSESTGDLVCPLLNGHRAGITHIRFSADGQRLWTGARGQDGRILCWDVRNFDHPLCVATYPRDVRTNQRCAFDFTSDSKFLVVGCRDGQVALYRLDELSSKAAEEGSSSPETDGGDISSSSIATPCFLFPAHRDIVNCVSAHPYYPQVLASSSGQRHDQASYHFSGGAACKRPAQESDCPQPREDTQSDSSTESDSSSEDLSCSPNGDVVADNSLKLWCVLQGAQTQLPSLIAAAE